MGRDWNCSIESFYPWIQMKDNFKKPSRKKNMGFCVVLTVALLKSNLRKNAALIRTSPCSGRTVVHPGHCPVKCCFLKGEALIMICNSCTKDHDPVLQKNCTQKSWPNTSKIAQRRAISMLHKITHKSVISWVKTQTENCTQKVHQDQPTHNFCNLMIRVFFCRILHFTSRAVRYSTRSFSNTELFLPLQASVFQGKSCIQRPCDLLFQSTCIKFAVCTMTRTPVG